MNMEGGRRSALLQTDLEDLVGTKSLEELFEVARKDVTQEREFMQALVDSTLWVHAPLSDDHERLRLIQFKHPEGFMAVPVFTSEARSDRAQGFAAKVLALPGRELFEATRGATLMINPNDGGPVLFAEEISALLKGESLPPLETISWPDSKDPNFGVRADPPSWISKPLEDLYSRTPEVALAFLVEMGDGGSRETLIVIGVPGADAERVVRSTALALQPIPEGNALNVTVFDPEEGLPEWLPKDLQPFYQSSDSPR